MNSNATKDLAKLEEYSLALIDFFDNLPNSFFDDENLSPPQRIVDYIVGYSKNQVSPLQNNTKLYRFAMN